MNIPEKENLEQHLKQIDIEQAHLTRLQILAKQNCIERIDELFKEAQNEQNKIKTELQNQLKFIINDNCIK